jgi:hypothetical protein
MNEWMDEWMNEWMNDWMNEWMNEWKNEWKNEEKVKVVPVLNSAPCQENGLGWRYSAKHSWSLH